MSEMPHRKPAVHAPGRSDCGERAEYETALREPRMWHSQATRPKRAAAPQDEIEIENTRSPAPTASPAKSPFDCLECLEHGPRLKVAFYQRHRIGEIAAGASVRGVENDRRGIEQIKLPLQLRDCCFNDLPRAAVPPVRPVRSNRHGIEVRCACHGCSPRSVQCRSLPPPTCRQ